MDKLHPHAAAIDRLGHPRIKAHYNISKQAIAYWRKKGVPKMHHNTLLMLAASAGVQMPELNQ